MIPGTRYLGGVWTCMMLFNMLFCHLHWLEHRLLRETLHTGQKITGGLWTTEYFGLIKIFMKCKSSESIRKIYLLKFQFKYVYACVAFDSKRQRMINMHDIFRSFSLFFKHFLIFFDQLNFIVKFENAKDCNIYRVRIDPLSVNWTNNNFP